MIAEVELYESPSKESNSDRYGELVSNQCICCYKPMKESEVKMVHMNTRWKAMHNSIKDEKDAEINGYKSQGFFPIGNSCAKKMPKEFIHQ